MSSIREPNLDLIQSKLFENRRDITVMKAVQMTIFLIAQWPNFSRSWTVDNHVFIVHDGIDGF